jgi:hypothetical protein
MGARQYVGDAHLQAGAAQLLELQQQVVRLLVSRILHRFKVKRVKDSRATAMPLTAHQKGEVTGTKLGDALKTPRLRATTARSAVVDMYCVYSSPFKYARRGHPNSKNTEASFAEIQIAHCCCSAMTHVLDTALTAGAAVIIDHL